MAVDVMAVEALATGVAVIGDGGAPARVDDATARAFAAFYERAQADLQDLAYNLLGNWHQAEDAVGATVAKVLPTWRVVEVRAAQAAAISDERADLARRLYIFKALKQVCLDEMRRRKCAPHSPLSLDWMGPGSGGRKEIATNLESSTSDNNLAERLVTDAADPVLDAICDRETLAEVRDLADARQWATLLLQEAGYSLEEAGLLLGTTRGAVKTGQWRLKVDARAAAARAFRPAEDGTTGATDAGATNENGATPQGSAA